MRGEEEAAERKEGGRSWIHFSGTLFPPKSFWTNTFLS
jgi:hypothetical protein